MKKRQFHDDLRNIFLNNSSISDYLFCIQTIIDSLSSIVEHVSESDHVDIVLNGLPDEFELLITFVSGKFESLSIDKVATLLLAHETQIARKKTLASSIALINLAEGAKPNFSPNSGQQDSHPQVYVAQGSGSLLHSGTNYNNYNGE